MKRKIFAFIVMILLVSDVVSAATIYGTVKDENGDGLPGANVYVTESGKTKFGAVANADGYYKINFPAGTYMIEPKFVGYTTNARTIRFNSDDNKKADFVMKQVAVQGEEQVVEATRLPPSGGSGSGSQQVTTPNTLPRKVELILPYSPEAAKTIQQKLEDSGNKVAKDRNSLNEQQKSCNQDSECGDGNVCFGNLCRSKSALDSCQESDGTKEASKDRYNSLFIKDIVVRENGQKESDVCGCIYSGEFKTDKSYCSNGFTHVQETSCGKVSYEIIECKNGCSRGACVSYDFDKRKLNVLERKVFDEYNGLTTEIGKIGRVQFLTDENAKQRIYPWVDALNQDAHNAVFLNPSNYNLMMFVRVSNIQKSLYNADYQNALVEINSKCKDCTEQGLQDFKTEIGFDEKQTRYSEVLQKQAEFYQNLIDRDSVSDPLFVNQVRQTLFTHLVGNPQIPGNLVKSRKLLADARNAFAEKNRASTLEIYNKKSTPFSSDDYTAMQQTYADMTSDFLKSDTLPLLGNQMQQVVSEAKATRNALTTSQDIFEDMNLDDLRKKADGDESLFAFYMTFETAQRFVNTASLYGEGKKLAMSTGVNRGNYECKQGIDGEINRAKTKIAIMLVSRSFGVKSFGDGDPSKAEIDQEGMQAYTLSDALYVVRDKGVSLGDAMNLIVYDNSNQNQDDLPDSSHLYPLKGKIKNFEIRDFKKLKVGSDTGLSWYYVKDYQGKEGIFIGCVAQGSSWNWPGDTNPVIITQEDALDYFEGLPLVQYDIELEKEINSASNSQLQKVVDSQTLKLARAFRERATSYPYNQAAYQQAVDVYSGLIAKNYRYAAGEENAVFNGNNEVYGNVQEELEDMLGGTWYDLNLADATTSTALVEGTVTEMTNVLWLAARAQVASRFEPYLEKLRPSVRRVVSTVLGASKEGQAAKGIAFSSSYAEFETRVASSFGKTKPGNIVYLGKKGFKFVTEEGAEEIFGAAAQSGVQAIAPNAPFIGDVVGMIGEIVGGGSVDLHAGLDTPLASGARKFTINKAVFENGLGYIDLNNFDKVKLSAKELALGYYWEYYVEGRYFGTFDVDGTPGWKSVASEKGISFIKPAVIGSDLVSVYNLDDIRAHSVKFTAEPKYNAEISYYTSYLDDIFSEAKLYAPGDFLSTPAYLRIQNALGDDFSLRVIKATTADETSYLYVPEDYHSLSFDKKDIDVFVHKYILGDEDPSEILLRSTLVTTSQETIIHPKTQEPLMIGDRGKLQYGSRYAYMVRFKQIWNMVYDEYVASFEKRRQLVPEAVKNLEGVRRIDFVDPDQQIKYFKVAQGTDKIKAAQNLLFYSYAQMDQIPEFYPTLFQSFDPDNNPFYYRKNFFRFMIFRSPLAGGRGDTTQSPTSSIKLLEAPLLRELGKHLIDPLEKIDKLERYAFETVNNPLASFEDRRNALTFLLEENKIAYGKNLYLDSTRFSSGGNYYALTPWLGTKPSEKTPLYLNDRGVEYTYTYFEGEKRILNEDYVQLSQELKEGMQFLDPGFVDVYNDPLFEQFGETSSDDAHYSAALATYRYAKRNPSVDIKSAIRVIAEERDAFRSLEILGPNTQTIIFTHAETRFNNEVMYFNSIRDFGVKEENIIGRDFKGREDKQQVLDAIAESDGKTTIWFNGHGSKDALWLESGLPQDLENTPVNDKKINAITYQELGDALLEVAKRNNYDLEKTVIMLDQCFSYDLGQNLYSYLHSHGVKKMPIFIGASNVNSYGFGDIFNFAIGRFHRGGQPLMGVDILESEAAIEGLGIGVQEGHKLVDFVIFVPDKSNAIQFEAPAAGECSAITCLPGGKEIGLVDNEGEQVA